MARAFSGIQPSGALHLGNYLGAVRNWVDIQTSHQAIFSVVDLHALTSDFSAKELSDRTLELTTGILACGVDPDKATLFLQSDVPQHTELAWFLACVTPMGELSRQTQYKSKSEEQAATANAGLFTYPVLQSADILLYKANYVPVGQDQEQHLELSREIARRFNARFGRTFPQPKTMFTSTPKIRGLDGRTKMSKSLNNHLPLDANESILRKRLAGAFTDPARQTRSDPGNPAICNIYDLHRYFSASDQLAEIDTACRRAAIGCVECKRRLAQAISEETAPIRERWTTLQAQPDTVKDILKEGAKRCREIASLTMAEVKTKVGLFS